LRRAAAAEGPPLLRKVAESESLVIPHADEKDDIELLRDQQILSG
jgi:hypothetical protein